MFSRDEHLNKMVLTLGDNFNKVFPYGIASLLIIGIIRVLVAPNDYFAYIDITGAISLFVVLFFGSSLNDFVRMSVVGIVITSIGLSSFFFFGTYGTGIIALILSNLIMIIFGRKQLYQINFLISTVGLVTIGLLKQINSKEIIEADYYFTILLFILITFVLNVAFSFIKEYMLKNIEALDEHLKRNEMIMNELALQNVEIKSNEKEIYNLAFYDQLTGLPKPALFRKHVTNRLEQINVGYMVVIDLKNFKLLNSIHGQEVGDGVLNIAGDILGNYKKGSFYPTRLSGNEFGLWFEDTSFTEIRQILSNMDDIFKERINISYNYNKIDSRIAFVEYPLDGSTYNDLFYKMMIALNYGKANYTTNLIKFEKEMEDVLLHESNLKRLLEAAISNGDFDVHYQEKYDSNNHCVVGVEALARWYSDILGQVSPGEFIPLISKYDMIESFELIIFEKVFSDYERLIKKYGQDITIGINVSPEHITSSGFIKTLKRLLLKYNVLPSNIVIEITEEVMIQGIESVEVILNQLRSIGFKISLDDFGSGYSSLNYLAQLPFDEIKIDKAFIDQIDNEKVLKVLKTVIELKMIYDVNVIAEGVEYQSQLDRLQSIGCYMIQGYLYSKPKPLC